MPDTPAVQAEMRRYAQERAAFYGLSEATIAPPPVDALQEEIGDLGVAAFGQEELGSVAPPPLDPALARSMASGIPAQAQAVEDVFASDLVGAATPLAASTMAPAPIKTQAEYDSLPSGRVYIDAETGQLGRKPGSSLATPAVLEPKSPEEIRTYKPGAVFRWNGQTARLEADGTVTVSQPLPSLTDQPVRVRSQEEYDGLPSGIHYIAPDGTLRMKK
jgi:hypothetical protein